VIPLSEFDRTHVEHILNNPKDTTWWSADMIRLIAKSDPQRKALLAQIVPSYVAAYEAWFHNPEEKE
jgi:capsular polysaccharide biosynthesis protein